LAGHRHAERYLIAWSFAESSFFPIPPDVLRAPITIAQPPRGWRFALVTTLASVLGGVAGYAIACLALDLI
jgi:membrane protein YqaA with SNARE-associated domain